MDLISDALTRIRNGCESGLAEVTLRKTKVVKAIVEILEREEFIDGFTEEDGELTVALAYDNKTSAIQNLERVSKGGQRVYVGVADLKPVLGGRGIGILSTSHGVMTVEEAKEKEIGGEYICKIW
jgi:small subunit ribosomal protein S8